MTMPYRCAASAAQIGQTFGVAAGADPWSGGAVTPGGFAPVITTGREFVAGPRGMGQPRRLVPRLWGVPPPPSAGERGRAVFTVRNLASPFWIGNLKNSEFRCLVPATAFMVRGKAGEARWLACADQPLFALAGVWKDSEVASFALLTCPANAALRALGRETMPAILPADPAAHDLWLRGDWARASGLLVPYPSGMISGV